MNRRRPTKRQLIEQAQAKETIPASEREEATPELEATPEPTLEQIEEALEGLDQHPSEQDEPLTGPSSAVERESDEARYAAPRLVAPSASTLMAQCGSHKITREELASIPTPEPTRTHQPIAHVLVVEALAEALQFRHIRVVREEFAVTPDGGKMFGVLDLDYEFSTQGTFRFAIGLRNSNDKSMRLGITIGYRVFVCDNMAFKGDFTPVLARHSRRLDLEETIAIGVDRMQRGFAPLREQITRWQEREVTDDRAKLLIYEAFLERALPVPRHLMPLVHRYYFKPEYEAFRPRTLWSLTNAFTSALKELKPVQQFQATAKLGSFFARHESSENGFPYNSQAPLTETVAVGA